MRRTRSLAMRDTQRQPAGRPAGRWLMVAVMLALSMSFGVLLGTGLDSDGDANASTMLTQLPEFDIVEETYDTIRENYVLSDEISDQELVYGASRGMVDALGDEGHSTFLDPQEAVEFMQSTRGELIGIGIQVDTTGPQPVVIAPIDGSPAFEAGVEPGDIIVAVDGVESLDVGAEEVTDLIRGEEGTDVTLTVRHQDATEPQDITITRAKIDIDPVSYVMLPDKVLWLRVSQFSAGATEGVAEALQYGKDQGMVGVVLDLRNNPGGLVSEAKGVGAQFLPDGSVLYQEQLADGSVHEVYTAGQDGEWQSGAIVVLINEGSASASEIISSAIRDNDRGVLYGETTFGTGTVLLPFNMSDDSMILLGTKLWLTADGNDIWKRGVSPNVEVELDQGASPRLPFEFQSDVLSEDQLTSIEDPQLTAAHEDLVETASQ